MVGHVTFQQVSEEVCVQYEGLVYESLGKGVTNARAKLF
jgi:hypothetical protein